MNDKDTVVVPGQLLALIEQARGYVADAINQPGEKYPPIMATYVREGVPSASASILVDTAVTAVAFALQDLAAAPSTSVREEESKADIAFLLARSGNAGKCMFGGERWTGISSNALVSIAFGEADDGLPFDSSDLAACYRAVMRLPEHRRTPAVFGHLAKGEAALKADQVEQARSAAKWPGSAALKPSTDKGDVG